MRTTSIYVLPHDLDMLSEVFGELLQDCEICRDSSVAEDIATRLIFIFDFGIRDRALLKRLTMTFLRQG